MHRILLRLLLAFSLLSVGACVGYPYYDGYDDYPLTYNPYGLYEGGTVYPSAPLGYGYYGYPWPYYGGFYGGAVYYRSGGYGYRGPGWHGYPRHYGAGRAYYRGGSWGGSGQRGGRGGGHGRR